MVDITFLHPAIDWLKPNGWPSTQARSTSGWIARSLTWVNLLPKFVFLSTVPDEKFAKLNAGSLE